MGHNSERPGNQQNKSEQSRQTDNVREMRMSSNGDPRMENQTATGRGESVTGDRSQSSSRSAGSEQRGLEGGSFTGSASPTSSGSFAQSEGINRGGASRAASHSAGNDSRSSGRWSNESDARERMESDGLPSREPSSVSGAGSAGDSGNERTRSGTHHEGTRKAS